MRLSVAFVVVALVACGDDDESSGISTPDAAVPADARPPDIDAFALAAPADRAALDMPGPYTVGYRVVSVTYRPVGLDTDRTLRLDVWYPAAAGTGTDTTYSVAGLIAVPRPGPRTGADVLPDGRFPLVVYSHGSGGVALAAFSYGELFASWGFVFVAPDHTGNTAIDHSNSFAMNFLVRPQDISATLDWAIDGSDSPVKGHLSGDVAAVGHSFGGYTVLSLLGARGAWADIAAACTEDCALYSDAAARAKLDGGFADPRVELAVAQAPVVSTFAPGELAAIDRPVLYMTARRDQTLPWDEEGQPGWDALDDASDVWVDLTNGGHYSFVAVCDVVSPTLLAAVGLDVESDGCGPTFTPIAEIMPPITAYTHAFVRQHALGEARWGDVIAGATFSTALTVTVGADR